MIKNTEIQIYKLQKKQTKKTITEIQKNKLKKLRNTNYRNAEIQITGLRKY